MNHREPASEHSWRCSFISNFDPTRLLKRWDVMFVASCVFAVSVDPLFLYVPVINEDYKCLWLDRRLEIVAICLRSITDMIYVANIFVQYSKDRAASVNGQTDVPAADLEHGRTEEASNAGRTAKRYPWLDLVIDILAILPLPQVLGACWYLFSIERETSCWSRACEIHGCTPSSFKCGHGSGDYTFLEQYCRVGVQETTKKAFFDFGMFSEALRSGIVTSTDIPQRILYSFWWGHRTLSSLGQNLETSTNFWENSFAVLISILGLILALCFIENLKIFASYKRD